mmetsp:Transcript_13597/g.57578  ORF Transcript_13597/g.57578 Transcript_13597/m.57578 type:complete len:312 (-) Transcript_13597:405-1340(-)
MDSTVSSAQCRFVPIIPLGPRLSHPATYTPVTCVGYPPIFSMTRPATFGTTPRSWSKGKPSLTPFAGKPLYPTDRKTKLTRSTRSFSPVGTALRDPAAPSSLFTARSTDRTLFSPSSLGRNSVGDRRNFKTSSRPPPAFKSASTPAGGDSIDFTIASYARRLGLCAARSASSSGSSASSIGSTVTRTPGRLSSSLSSFGENAPCATPLLPTITTRRTVERRNASSACWHTSVDARCSGARSSIRAQSTATLPRPNITAVSPSAHASALLIGASRSFTHLGSPLYHPTNSRALCDPGRSSPGTPSFLSPSAP